LEWDQYRLLIARLKDLAVEFVIEPNIRFEGRRGEQATLFIRDPSGNHLEFKAFRDIGALFDKDLDSY
jgi:extradiol dioxygenase family protein